MNPTFSFQLPMTVRTLRTAWILAMLAAVCLRVFAADTHDHGAQDHDDHGHEGHEHGEHTEEIRISLQTMHDFGITVETAQLQVLAESIAVPARVAYNGEKMAHIGTPVAGWVADIQVRLGDEVKAGDLLAVIESPELGEAESEFIQRGSMVEAALSAVEVARIAFERAEELRKSNSMSVSDFLSRQGDLKKAEGELKVAQASHIAAENRLHILGITQENSDRLAKTAEVSNRFELRAPIDGTVVEREVTPGEVVSQDREALMVLANTKSVWVLADVPERMANRIDVGSRGRIALPFSGDAFVVGDVDYIAPQLNPRTRTAEVRLLADVPRNSRPSAPPDAHEHHGDEPGHDHGDKPALTEAQIAEFKAKGDWWAEHEVPESQCVLCNPELAEKLQAAAEPKQTTLSLRPGMFAQVELELSPLGGVRGAKVIAIPEEAIQTVEGQPSVFVPGDEPDTFKPRPLVLGRRVGLFVPVLSGLKEGDQYVATGSFLLKAEHGKAGAEHVH